MSTMIGERIQFRYKGRRYIGWINDKVLMRDERHGTNMALTMIIDHYMIQCNEFEEYLFIPCNDIVKKDI